MIRTEISPENTAIDNILLQKLNALSFYKQPAPKSLGIEWVNAEITPFAAKCIC